MRPASSSSSRPRRCTGHRRHRQVVQGLVELLGVHRRRSRPGDAGRGRPDQYGVHPVPPDRHGWPLSVKGILVTEGVRGDGGVSKNSEGKRFMFDYIPSVFKGQYAETEAEADQWLKEQRVSGDSARRTPDRCPTRWPARSTPRSRAGRGSPARRRLPRHRVADDAGRDQASSAVDVPPVPRAGRGRHHQGRDGSRDRPATTSWAVSRSDPGTGARRPPACSRQAKRSGGTHGSNRSAATRCRTCWCSGRRATGSVRPTMLRRARAGRPVVSEAAVEEEAAAIVLTPFKVPQGTRGREEPLYPAR